MAVSVFFILRNNYRRSYFFHKETHKEGDNKGSIMQTLSHLPEDTTVVIDGSKSHNIDIDVLEIIHDFKNTAELKNIKLELKNIPEFIGVAGH